MAKKSNMKIILGVGAVAAAAGIGYYFYRKKSDEAVAGLGLLDVSTMGAVAHKAYRWQFLTDGQFGTMEGGDMHNWTKVRRLPHVAPPPNPVLFYVRGGHTGNYYALADEYAYLLLHWNGSSWVRVKA